MGFAALSFLVPLTGGKSNDHQREETTTMGFNKYLNEIVELREEIAAEAAAELARRAAAREANAMSFAARAAAAREARA